MLSNKGGKLQGIPQGAQWQAAQEEVDEQLGYSNASVTQIEPVSAPKRHKSNCCQCHKGWLCYASSVAIVYACHCRKDCGLRKMATGKLIDGEVGRGRWSYTLPRRKLRRKAVLRDFCSWPQAGPVQLSLHTHTPASPVPFPLREKNGVSCVVAL